MPLRISKTSAAGREPDPIDVCLLPEEVYVELGFDDHHIAVNWCVRYKIGGTGHRTVGFLHVLPGCPQPTMDPDALIYLESVAEHWYVYRT